MLIRTRASRFIVALFFAIGGLCIHETRGLSQPGAKDESPKIPAEIQAKLPKKADQGPVLQRRNPRYQIGSGDVLDLKFQFTPEFDQTVTVQPDGFINLRSVGDLHVEGKTAPEVQKALEQSYSGILREPVISVTLKEFEKPYFLALGQLERPGKHDLRGNTTLTEAVTIAGGFNGKAKHSQVFVFRRVSNDWVSVKEVNVKDMLNKGNLQEDVDIEAGDMVYVPQNRISKIRPFIPLPSLSYYLR